MADIAGTFSRCGDHLQAFILLGGGLSPSPLTAATRCSVLDLLVGPGQSTVLDRWLDHVGTLGKMADDGMPVLIANGGGTPAPRLDTHSDRRIELVADKESYRGTAGVVCDVSSHLDDGALLLVAEAARCPDFDLAASVRHHLSNGSEATVLVNPDGTPAGIYLMTRHLLKYVQREGYMDLKEQWLNRVVENDHHVGVHRISNGFARPLRTREQLLHAAMAATSGDSEHQTPPRFASEVPARARDGFRCIASDARVDASAVVVDSIIMPGASIGSSSVVTRSIVCANCKVPANAMIVDAVRGSGEVMETHSSTSGPHREHAS